MKYLWYLDWEDLCGVYPTLTLGMADVEKEAGKMRAKIIWTEITDDHATFSCRFWPGHYTEFYTISKVPYIERVAL